MSVGQVYGTGTGIDSGIVSQPITADMDASEQDFWRKVDQFKAKSAEAYALWQKLRAKRQAAVANPELQREYDDVMGQAESIQAKASDVERAVASVREGIGGTITSWFGLEGYQHATRQLGQLGFVQVIAIAAVAGAIAWLGSWIVEANIVDRKLTAVENLTAQGVDPRVAGDMVAEKGDPGPMAALLGNMGTGVGLAAVAAVVLYFFFQKKRGF